jgi:preprotein translocase subunit SecE
MADAAKINKEEQGHQVSGFSLMEPVGKLAQYPRRLRSFLHDVRVEMKLVNWPTWLDVKSTTIIVTITVAFFGIYFWITDLLFGKGIGALLHYFDKH